jgi:hypothetical protein
MLIMRAQNIQLAVTGPSWAHTIEGNQILSEIPFVYRVSQNRSEMTLMRL